MSNLTIRFYSNCLRRYTTFKMYLPCDIRQDWGQTDTKYSENSTKTLFLLHGFTGDAENWVPEYLSDKYNFAVVIPSGENFFLAGRTLDWSSVLQIRRRGACGLCKTSFQTCERRQ